MEETSVFRFASPPTTHPWHKPNGSEAEKAEMRGESKEVTSKITVYQCLKQRTPPSPAARKTVARLPAPVCDVTHYPLAPPLGVSKMVDFLVCLFDWWNIILPRQCCFTVAAKRVRQSYSLGKMQIVLGHLSRKLLSKSESDLSWFAHGQKRVTPVLGPE